MRVFTLLAGLAHVAGSLLMLYCTVVAMHGPAAWAAPWFFGMTAFLTMPAVDMLLGAPLLFHVHDVLAKRRSR